MATEGEKTEKTGSVDAGLITLVTLLRFNGIGADPEQIRHRFGGARIGIPEMLRVAKELGLKARSRTSSWSRLATTPLPAIAALRDGGFLFLGKVGDDKALVQSPFSPRPELMTREQLEAVWDGRLVMMTRRAGLLDLSRRFDITWFLGAIHKYRHLLGEVMVASFFLQVFALVSPLFFQVVIDKVLVHRSMSTLDVLIVGLIAIGVFETVLGILRTYLFAHTTNRIDVELVARLFRHLLALPIAYFQARRVGDFRRARAGAGKHPQLSDQLRAHPHHRSVLHVRISGGDVLLFDIADLDRDRLAAGLCRHLDCGDASVPPPTRREVPARRGEPGLFGRERHRG
jgi:subfamily B ATP-binding cassette protein HlyB/CyaB